MKKWNNPKIVMLGIENTNDDSVLYKPPVHSGYCHQGTGGSCTGTVNEHSDDNSSNPNATHWWTGTNSCTDTNHRDAAGNVVCCCGGLS